MSQELQECQLGSSWQHRVGPQINSHTAPAHVWPAPSCGMIASGSVSSSPNSSCNHKGGDGGRSRNQAHRSNVMRTEMAAATAA